MLGSDYGSYEDFRHACLHERRPLDAYGVLGKVYSAAHLGNLAWRMDLDLDAALEDLPKRRGGIGTRYDIAGVIARIPNAEFGWELSRIDHDLAFPFATYFGFPESDEYEAPGTLVSYLEENRSW